MKIIIQYFEDGEEQVADRVEWLGDAIGHADSWDDARNLLNELERGHTVPSGEPKTENKNVA